jgi:predicted  nucleic acid-binding Zn-ribbon protein
MNENDFQVKLSELIGQIDQLPENERDALQKLAAESKNRHEKVRKTIADLQDSIDYLRLSIKYLVFDLEATRRENAHLRKLLEERTSEGSDESGEE